MSVSQFSHIQWRKSSRSSASDCVEMAVTSVDTDARNNQTSGTVVLVRDSKNPTQILRFTSSAWAAFISDMKKS